MAQGPVLSVLVETLILAPLAVAWLWGMHAGHWHDIDGRTGGVFGQDLGTSLLLVCAGPLTGGPLLLFSYAARRLPYATVGLLQYLNPHCSSRSRSAVFGEAFTVWHAIAFPLIWAALALYSWEGLRRSGGSSAGQARPSRAEAVAPEVVGEVGHEGRDVGVDRRKPRKLASAKPPPTTWRGAPAAGPSSR